MKQIKLYNASDITCDEGKREVVGVINTGAIDRDGEIVQPKGMRKKDFQNNPVVFANHAYMTNPTALPIGYSKWVKSGQDSDGNDVVIAKTYVTDKTQEGRDVFGLLQDKVLNAFSIGFESLRASKPSTAEINVNPGLKKCKNIVRDWNMFEYSVVGLPCNQEALTLAVSKGVCQNVLDMISNKAGNTAELTAEIVEAVENDPSLAQKNIRSEKDIRKRIAKYIDEAVVSIDADRIVEAAIKRLVK